MDTNQNSGFNSGMAGAPPMEDWQGGSDQTKRTIKEKTREKTAQIKESARDTAQSLKQKGTEKAHELQERGNAFAEGRKSELAHKISGCGAAVRRAADKLRDENDPNIASYADLIADRFEAAGSYVETRDLNAMYHDLENAARRRPEILFGGMFMAGLVLARFLKASDTRSEYEADEENYWVEDEYEPVAAPITQTPDYSPAAPVTPSPTGAPTPGSGANNPGWSPQ